MRLSPLQSRLAVSLHISLFIVALYWLLFPSRFALAAELPLQSVLVLDVDPPVEPVNDLQHPYEPDFGLFDRSIIGRAAVEAQPIKNNKPKTLNVEPGDVACYVFSKSDLEGSRNSRKRQTDHGPLGVDGDGDGEQERRDDTTPLFLSANTCLQPAQTDSDSNSPNATQLKMLVANSKNAGCPTTTEGMDDDMWVEFDEGAAAMALDAKDAPVYVSILAPKLPDGSHGTYNFELAVSLDKFYHKSDMVTELLWMDSDSSAAILVTRNLTYQADDAQKIMKSDPPYELYVENTKWPAFNGIRRSPCGMSKQALISSNKEGDGRLNNLVRSTMSTRGAGGFPKQQFYFEGLNKSSNYRAVLVQVADIDPEEKRQDGSSSGPTTVYEPIEFDTLSGTTCKVITDLDFCSQTQYAVPGNPKFDGPELAKAYDEYAKKMYENFEKIMMQVPCETGSTSAYSLARDCDDCRDAYKRWLCTVAIPRCEDYRSSNPYAIVRSAGQPFADKTMIPEDDRFWTQRRAHNTSRNAFINEDISPGPYVEVLPCQELCYEVVQACPASIGFTCPRPGMAAFDYSYGVRVQDSDDYVACNYPGEPRTKVDAAGMALPPILLVSLVSLSVTLTLL